MKRQERFFIAAFDGQTDLLRGLLAQDKSLITARDEIGRTALHLAMGYLETVQLLLEQGADPTARAQKNWTPLHYTPINHGDDPRCQLLLLRAGAKLEAKNSYGSTPLFEAVSGSCLGSTALLIGAGANLTTKTRSGETPRTIADQLHLLVSHSRCYDFQRSEINGIRELLAACENSCSPRPSPPRLSANERRRLSRKFPMSTLIELACEGNSHDLGEISEEFCGIVHLTDAEGMTLLHHAAGQAQSEAVDLLLFIGSDPNRRDLEGNTPLHHAAASGWSAPASLHLLCEAGADLAAVNGQGKTPLDAVQDPQSPAAMYLQGRGLRK